jgi:hypothetical protein
VTAQEKVHPAPRRRIVQSYEKRIGPERHQLLTEERSLAWKALPCIEHGDGILRTRA